MNKMVNGVVIKLTPEEEALVLAEGKANVIEKAAVELALARKIRKDELVREKVESLLVSEIAQINAASDIRDIKAVRIK